MSFESLRLIPALTRAVATEGYTQPTPIQAQAIPHVLEGRDLLGIAQTGTGKTAAFVLPIVQNLVAKQKHGGVRVLVLAPTRELASQIDMSFKAYGRHTPVKSTVIFGGVGQEPQVAALRRGVDVVVATPGRLLDLINQGHAQLGHIEVLVLDEADRMLDMGFIHDVKRIIARLPVARQTLFFSATMPDEVAALARNILRDPVRVEVTPGATTVEKIDQSIYFIEKTEKRRLLAHLLRDPQMARVLVFTRTKHGADRVVKDLDRAGFGAQAIHGNKGQSARERALKHFKDGTTRVLVATDIAARGIDVDDITHVVNFDLPNIPESYVHRIGRTARAGATGVAVSFCDHEEREYLVDIERLIRMHVPRVEDHPFRSPEPPPPPTSLDGRRGAPPQQARPKQPQPQQRHRSQPPRQHPRPQVTRPAAPAVAAPAAGGATPAARPQPRPSMGRRSFGRRRP